MEGHLKLCFQSCKYGNHTQLVTIKSERVKAKAFQKLPTLIGKNLHKHIPLHNK